MRIPAAQTQPSAIEPARARARAIAVRVVHSPDPAVRGACFELRARPLIIGRAIEGGALIDDTRLSRRHCVIQLEADREVSIEDLNSSNGTYVDGARISGTVILRAGCVIRAGATVLVLDEEPEADLFPVDDRAEAWVPEIAGESYATRRLRSAVVTIAATQDPVLILGESGCGKEVAARAIHRASGRSGPFVAVNCAAIPVELAEAELFGCKKGAFTGADQDRLGFFQQSSRGTLFLDEVGELPLNLQAKLLRALEEGSVQPLGGGAPVPVDLRIVAATNRDLDKSRFRADLRARLEDWVLQIPPLRERRADVLALWAHFAGDAMRERSLTDHFAEALLLHDWRLNARELRKLTRRIVQLYGSEHEWALRHLPAYLSGRASSTAPAIMRGAPDRAAIVEALENAGGNVSKCASALGCHRKQLYRWMERFAIDACAYRPAEDEDRDTSQDCETEECAVVESPRSKAQARASSRAGTPVASRSG